MTTTDALATYDNGNTRVSIFADGTKVRTWSGGEPRPEFPESIDLKITNYCDAGCAWCHEKSTRQGVPADLWKLERTMKSIPAGVELAIGGGNPVSHPQLHTFLWRARELGLIANLTVNARHLYEFGSLLRTLRAAGLIRGLGLSYAHYIFDQIFELSDENTVVHLIAGVDRPADAARCLRNGSRKVLILGYKSFGFGIPWAIKNQPRLDEWRYWTPSLLRITGGIVSFDNLALEQLGVRSMIAPETWDRHYMGDDGRFSMYIDAVRSEYAATSTAARRPMGEMTVPQMFASLQ